MSLSLPLLAATGNIHGRRLSRHPHLFSPEERANLDGNKSLSTFWPRFLALKFRLPRLRIDQLHQNGEQVLTTTGTGPEWSGHSDSEYRVLVSWVGK